jgi:hypothetical protein
MLKCVILEQLTQSMAARGLHEGFLLFLILMSNQVGVKGAYKATTYNYCIFSTKFCKSQHWRISTKMLL